MKLDIFSYNDLISSFKRNVREEIEFSFLHKGIVGISDIPSFETKSRIYINAARAFCALKEEIKKQYAPNRDQGNTEGYEMGAEWFKDQNGEWKIDDKKASFYAFVPDKSCNKWPLEVDLKTSYLQLGELIFNVSKLLLNMMGLNQAIGINHDLLTGYGRLLHYHKENQLTNANPNWCGAHYDHGLLTGLLPAYYFRDGIEIDEPPEAGLFVAAPQSTCFEKIRVDQSILLFQIGEFGQLISNDRFNATKHLVKKAHDGIERFTLALFTDTDYDFIIRSRSKLIEDARYYENQSQDGSISYRKWQDASYERYRARENALT